MHLARAVCEAAKLTGDQVFRRAEGAELRLFVPAEAMSELRQGGLRCFIWQMSGCVRRMAGLRIHRSVGFDSSRAWGANVKMRGPALRLGSWAVSTREARQMQADDEIRAWPHPKCANAQDAGSSAKMQKMLAQSSQQCHSLRFRLLRTDDSPASDDQARTVLADSLRRILPDLLPPHPTIPPQLIPAQHHQDSHCDTGAERA